MTITFQGILMASVVVETILWARSSVISSNRDVEIEKLKKEVDRLKSDRTNYRDRCDVLSDIICKRDNELSTERKKYKKCIQYIKKINKENKK